MPHYRVLGLTVGATRAQIKASYLALAKQWHPDLHHGDPKAAEKFKVIQEAYEALSSGRGGASAAQQQQQPHQRYYDEGSARNRRHSGTARGAAGAGGHNWGPSEANGNKPGQDPFGSYMGFGRNGSHW